MVQESIKHFPIPLRKSLKAIAEGDFLAKEGVRQGDDPFFYGVGKYKALSSTTRKSHFRVIPKKGLPSVVAKAIFLSLV